MKKQILILFKLLPEQIEEINKTAEDYEIVETLEEVNIKELEIIIGWTNDLIPIIENDESTVKWIQFPFAGVNTLPLELFKEKNILLSNGSGVHTYAVSESAMALLLTFTRNINESLKYQAQELWRDSWADSTDVYELFDKTMMIVGTGKIGVHLGRIAKGFGMKTIGINRSGRKVENMDTQYVQNELKEVIHQADIVVNILPATKATNHLFNAEMFNKMKNHSIFINVGRGETVDTQAMIEALNNDKLMYVGLDVFEEEPLPKGHALWKHEKVIMTPHIAGRVESYPKHFYPIIKKNLESFINGDGLTENNVELENGY